MRSIAFNEAAGIHRRKLMLVITITAWLLRFNEAAGIHRRKRGGLGGGAHRGSAASMRPPEIHRRKLVSRMIADALPDRASMRPPEFTGGNTIQRPPWVSVSTQLQ